MTLCPVAIAVGCRKCPIFSVCPAKGLIGDQRKEDEAATKQPSKATPAKSRGAAQKGKRR